MFLIEVSRNRWRSIYSNCSLETNQEFIERCVELIFYLFFSFLFFSFFYTTVQKNNLEAGWEPLAYRVTSTLLEKISSWQISCLRQGIKRFQHRASRIDETKKKSEIWQAPFLLTRWNYSHVSDVCPSSTRQVGRKHARRLERGNIQLHVYLLLFSIKPIWP